MKTTLVVKLTRRTFQSGNGEFNLYLARLPKGKLGSMVYVGEDPPKPLKSVEYQLTGEWEDNPRFGRQFKIEQYRRHVAELTPSEKAELAIVREAMKHI